MVHPQIVVQPRIIVTNFLKNFIREINSSAQYYSRKYGTYRYQRYYNTVVVIIQNKNLTLVTVLLFLLNLQILLQVTILSSKTRFVK